MQFLNNAVLFALAVGFLGQECLATLSPPQRNAQNKVIYSRTQNAAKIGATGMTAAAQAMIRDMAPLVPSGQTSAGVTIWYSSSTNEYIAAAIGGGAGGHGEQNIYTICETLGVKMAGGEIGTYWKGPPAKWIPACNPSKMNCAGAIAELGIADRNKEWNKGVSRSPSPGRGKRSLPERSQKFARALLAEQLAI